ncbi:MAG: energy transducer TonB [Steroidobacteraceae bacterium]
MTIQLRTILSGVCFAALCLPPPVLAQQSDASRFPLPPLALSLSNNVYPATSHKAGVQGRVLVSFTIKRNGTPDDVAVIAADPEGQFDEVAVRVVKQVRFSVPKDWKDSGAVAQPFRLSVLFKLRPCPAESCVTPVMHDEADDFLIVAANRLTN